MQTNSLKLFTIQSWHNNWFILQETQSQINLLLKKEKSDSISPAVSQANDNATSHEAADQPTPPDTQHGKNICSFIHVGDSYCTVM